MLNLVHLDKLLHVRVEGGSLTNLVPHEEVLSILTSLLMGLNELADGAGVPSRRVDSFLLARFIVGFYK